MSPGPPFSVHNAGAFLVKCWVPLWEPKGVPKIRACKYLRKRGGAFQVSDKGPNFGTQAGTKNRKTNSNQTQPKSAKHSQLALEGCPKN